jgi:hypothetical protein
MKENFGESMLVGEKQREKRETTHASIFLGWNVSGSHLSVLCGDFFIVLA